MARAAQGLGAAAPAEMSSAPVDCPIRPAGAASRARWWEASCLLTVVMAISHRSRARSLPDLIYYYLPIATGLRDSPANIPPYTLLASGNVGVWLVQTPDWPGHGRARSGRIQGKAVLE